MNLITTQKHKFIGSQCSENKLSMNFLLVTFCVFMFTFFFHGVYAQNATLHLFSVAPDWNNKSFCGAGAGYHPSRIVAPSVSYSGKDVNDPVYEFYWEQKKNDGEWMVIESSKNSKFIPAFDPKVLYNDKPGGPSMKYTFRLRVVDLANGKQEAVSDEYSIIILSGMLASHKIVNANGVKNIELNIVGGFDEKKYDWKLLQGLEMKDGVNNHTRNLMGISEGAYEVVVDDGGCPAITYRVDVSK